MTPDPRAEVIEGFLEWCNPNGYDLTYDQNGVERSANTSIAVAHYLACCPLTAPKAAPAGGEDGGGWTQTFSGPGPYWKWFGHGSLAEEPPKYDELDEYRGAVLIKYGWWLKPAQPRPEPPPFPSPARAKEGEPDAR